MSLTATRQEGIEVYEKPLTFTTMKQVVTSITDSTKTVTAAESGTIFTLNRAGGITVTLPTAAAGLMYEFHIGTTFTGTLTINADSASDTLQGVLTMVDTDITVNDLDDGVENCGFSKPAAADHQIVMDADGKGRLLGGMIKYVCITDSKWVVSGHTIGDGAIVTPFT